MPFTTKWTLLTYIAAHNNLEELGKNSLLEILNVGSTRDVVHGVLYDGGVGAARYVMGDAGVVQYQEQLGSFDSGDPDGLIAMAKWLFDKHPAERYGLILWSHGTGWEPWEIEAVTQEARPGAQMDSAELRERAGAPGSMVLFRSTLREILKPDKPAERAILFDDGTGHSLDTLELSRVVGTIADSIGKPIELLGMDACLMANLEVAYEVRRAVRHLVASEGLVPGHSWPYGGVFGELRAAADMSNHGEVLWKVQHTARQRETEREKRKPSKFNYHLWDIGSLAAGLARSEAVSATVKQAAADILQALLPGAGAVLAEGHRGAWFDGIGGISVYLMPPKQERISPSYSKLAFARNTRWDEMLFAY